MTLREAKQRIREFIREHWSDQKLAEVYAFNRDQKMDYFDMCGCLLGVTLSKTLHNMFQRPDCGRAHYQATHLLPGAKLAEVAYDSLGKCGLSSWYMVSPRRNRLSAILRAEMRRRERVRASQESREVVEVGA